DDALNLLRGRPDVAQVNLVSCAILADGIIQQVDVNGSGQPVCNHERRRGQEVGLHKGMDAPLEVAVAGEHAGDDKVALLDGPGNGLRQWPGVADAGRATVSNQIVAELVEVR